MTTLLHVPPGQLVGKRADCTALALAFLDDWA
jgi:hypothetical protein